MAREVWIFLNTGHILDLKAYKRAFIREIMFLTMMERAHCRLEGNFWMVWWEFGHSIQRDIRKAMIKESNSRKNPLSREEM